MAQIKKSALYEAASESSDQKIVRRFARRNVKLQIGAYTSDLTPIVREGDRAMARLRAKFGVKQSA